MSEPVTLLVPIGDRYRDLAIELARKYMELAGGSPADADGVAAAVKTALHEVEASGHAEDASLTFRVDAGGVEIDVRCGRQSSAVIKPLPARNR